MTKLQTSLLEYGGLTVRIYDNSNWETMHLHGNKLKKFVNRIDTEYDETMYKVRDSGLIDIYLN